MGFQGGLQHPATASASSTPAAEPSGDGEAGRASSSGPAPAHLEYCLQKIWREARDEGRVAEGAEERVAQARGSSGMPLPGGLRERFEGSLGTPLGGVQLHTDGTAARAAESISARAYTVGQDIYFAQGQYDPGSPTGQRLLGHEVAHTVQQAGGAGPAQGKLEISTPGDRHEVEADQAADAMVSGRPASVSAGGALSRAIVQRYEAGEHAQTGDTGDLLKSAYAPIQYVVVDGDTLQSIADKFKITVAELKEANKDKLKKLEPAKGKGAPKGGGEEGFAPGEKVAIPQKLNDMAKGAAGGQTLKVKVNGVELDYGTLIAMGGDLFGSVEELAKASPEELKAIAALVEEEKKTGKTVSTERWQQATKGRFLKLAEKNESHFAPSNSNFVPPSGKSSGDHKSTWEQHHKAALEAAQSGDKDKALLINGFGDHFLTDAFSAGHLFNKRDLMEQFKGQFKQDKDGDFLPDSVAFFDAIAKPAFVGDVKTEFSKYETVKFEGYVFRPNIDSASIFSKLLQGIHKEEPDLLSSAVAKGVHDRLDHHPGGGLSVENGRSQKWKLSGDDTLNAETLAVAKQAVAQSQQNVIGAYQKTGALDYAALYQGVWSYTPKPTKESEKEVKTAVSEGTDLKSTKLQQAMVDLITANYKTIIAELVKRNKLKLA